MSMKNALIYAVVNVVREGGVEYMKPLIERLILRENLSRVESFELFSKLINSPLEQQGAIIALLTAKGETQDELLGARDFFISRATPMQSELELIDIAGTGGDGIGTFNISTTASLVVASCGVTVAKHGGRSATSLMGSVDLFESLGIKATPDPEKILNNLREDNFAFICGPLFNEGLRAVGMMRKNLGFSSLFNKLGPLLNPLEPKRQILGVNRKELLPRFAQLLKELRRTRAMVVHSDDGMDELSVSAVNHVVELRNGVISEYQINPTEAGLPLSSLADIKSSSKEENTEICRGILLGKIQGPKLDIVLLNSAAALLVADKVNNLREGVLLAKSAIQSGKTAALLNKLRSQL